MSWIEVPSCWTPNKYGVLTVPQSKKNNGITVLKR